MTHRLMLDEIVDAAGARVIVERGDDGRTRTARFDLAGLPRVDPLLVGRPVAGVPSLVERLCGICPAAHHLAGVRALEGLAGLAPLPATATAVRRLLHHGSAVETHATRMLVTDRDDAALLRLFGRAALAAAGSPGHFPVTAVPGGVASAVTTQARDGLAAGLDEALAAAGRIARAALALDGPVEAFDGADAALVDAAGRPDLLGELLRVVGADGTVIEAGGPATRWDQLVAEAVPGDPAPRPYLLALGPQRGRYRVGPVAQLRIGPLTTPVAAALQEQWLAGGGGARAARAVMAVHSVEAIGVLLGQGALVRGPAARPVAGFSRNPVGVGWVDGPRGLLVHRYAADGDGTVTAATILTPTAQNEPWLAELLAAAAGAGDQASSTSGMEDAIREADPCLPCSSAPAGGMGLQVETVPAPTRRSP
ncbi:MAG: nickel-dependent hydrogenase large subunit [Actinobacteria bacterium]|nr:nickel-dependent hydrogenase large subunit [Actinomycetota bacterium]